MRIFDIMGSDQVVLTGSWICSGQVIRSGSRVFIKLKVPSFLGTAIET
jgi:hypothetical protein